MPVQCLSVVAIHRQLRISFINGKPVRIDPLSSLPLMRHIAPNMQLVDIQQVVVLIFFVLATKQLDEMTVS